MTCNPFKVLIFINVRESRNHRQIKELQLLMANGLRSEEDKGFTEQA